jgi:hypothetical protein
MRGPEDPGSGGESYSRQGRLGTLKILSGKIEILKDNIRL